MRIVTRTPVKAVWWVLALGWALAACKPSSGAGSLRVGVLPDRAESELRLLYDPLIDYLSAATGLSLELTVPGSYDGLLQSFESGDLQLAWFGGLTFIHAERTADAEALVMRDIDLKFTSDFVVASSTPGESIEDFLGKRLAFGPRLSTSGHLMPRYFLRELGLEPESSFAEVRHSAGHDQTVIWVKDGRVDLGAVNSVVLASMLGQGRLGGDQIRVLWKTPPYRNYVWAVRNDLDPDLKTLLTDAFLALEMTEPGHTAILAAQGAAGYVPASNRDFDDLRRAAEMFDELLPGAQRE